MDYMGQAVPVYDIRRKMGIVTLAEEIKTLIDALGRRSKGDETEEILILNIEKFLLDETGTPPALLPAEPDTASAS